MIRPVLRSSLCLTLTVTEPRTEQPTAALTCCGAVWLAGFRVGAAAERAAAAELSGGNSGATLFVLDAALASDAPCTLPSESVSGISSGVLSSLAERWCMHGWRDGWRAGGGEELDGAHRARHARWELWQRDRDVPRAWTVQGVLRVELVTRREVDDIFRLVRRVS